MTDTKCIYKFAVPDECSEQLKALADAINDFYLEESRTSSSELDRCFVESTQKHSLRVASNVSAIYCSLGQELNQDVYAAALCHDMGRMTRMPKSWTQGTEVWETYVNEHHHEMTGEACGTYLRQAGYDSSESQTIRDIAISHGYDNISQSSPMETRIIKLADRLDKLDKDGINRLYCNRRQYINPDASDTEILKDVESIMKRAYEACMEMGLSPELVEARYQEGVAELEKLKGSLSEKHLSEMSQPEETLSDEPSSDEPLSE